MQSVHSNASDGVRPSWVVADRVRIHHHIDSELDILRGEGLAIGPAQVFLQHHGVGEVVGRRLVAFGQPVEVLRFGGFGCEGSPWGFEIKQALEHELGQALFHVLCHRDRVVRVRELKVAIGQHLVSVSRHETEMPRALEIGVHAQGVVHFADSLFVSAFPIQSSRVRQQASRLPANALDILLDLAFFSQCSRVVRIPFLQLV